MAPTLPIATASTVTPHELTLVLRTTRDGPVLARDRDPERERDDQRQGLQRPVGGKPVKHRSAP